MNVETGDEIDLNGQWFTCGDVQQMNLYMQRFTSTFDSMTLNVKFYRMIRLNAVGSRIV